MAAAHLARQAASFLLTWEVMRIDATTLAVEGLRYRATRDDGAENDVVLGQSGGVTGFYETAPSGHTADAQARELEVRRAVWRIGGGSVTVEEPARLGQVTLRLDIPSGDAKTQLRIGLETARLPRLRYATASLTVSMKVELEGALIERDAAGKLSVVAVSAVLRDVALQAGSTQLSVGLVRARRLVVVSDGDALRIAADGLELMEMRLTAGDVTVQATKLEAPRGVAWQDGRIEVAELSLAQLGVDCDFPAPDAAAPLAVQASAPPKPAKRLPDIPALDQLDGHLALDIHVNATLPLLKERGATHALRIPVDRGAISFGELEDGFSAVADALLDFELEGDVLKLELDVIPIVKFDNIALLSWKLVDAVDRELARQKAIRLRRLLQFDRPSSREDKPAKRHDKGMIRLLGIDIAPIAVDLSARAPIELQLAGGRLRLDDGAGRAVESLKVGGELHVSLEGDSVPGHLDGSVRGIVAALDSMAFGAFQVDAAVVALDSVVSVHADFDGVSPTRIKGSIPSVRVRDARLQVGGEGAGA